jgi:hypothetical protein
MRTENTNVAMPKRETAWWPFLGLVALAVGLLARDNMWIVITTFTTTTIGTPFLVAFLDWRRRKREQLPAEATARIGHRTNRG